MAISFIEQGERLQELTAHVVMLFEGAGFPRFRVFRVGQQEAWCIFQITFQRGVTLAVPAVFLCLHVQRGHCRRRHVFLNSAL